MTSSSLQVVRWYPTSRFTVLPFRAAGPYRRNEKNPMGIYVSSYARSLLALIRAYDRIRSQRAAREASPTADMISFAAVGRVRPKDGRQAVRVPEVEHGIQRIRDGAHAFPTYVTCAYERDIQDDRDGRRGHRRRCRTGILRPPLGPRRLPRRAASDKPAMADGELTPMRIVQERFANLEFALLSACYTVVGDASTLDKVLYLTAGMQFLGFNGVIGTLRKVDDAAAHQVVAQFYKEMFKRPRIGFKNAAAALNSAVLMKYR